MVQSASCPITKRNTKEYKSSACLTASPANTTCSTIHCHSGLISFGERRESPICADIATGTGDLAIQLQRKLRPDQVIGVDLSEGMMEVGRQKVAKAGLSSRITFEQQDSIALTYKDNQFDAVTAAFGVRNFERIEQGIAEMYRVLKPGGHLMILELSTPEHFPIAQTYRLYSSVFIPLIGRMLAKDKAAYHYLPASIKVVPQGQVMTELLQRIGFKDAHAQTFTFGICSMYTGTK